MLARILEGLVKQYRIPKSAAAGKLKRLYAKEKAGTETVLAVFLNHPYPGIRRRTCWVIAGIEARSLAGKVAQKLGDSDHTVVVSALKALKTLRARECSRKVAALLGSDRPEVVQEAIDTLVKLGAEAYVARIAKQLNAEDRLTRLQAIDAVASLGEPKHARLLTSLLNDRNFAERANRAIKKLRGKK